MSASWEKGGLWGSEASPSASRPLPLMLILGMLSDVSTLMSGRPVAADEAVKQRSMSDLSFYPNHHYSEVLQTQQKMQGMFNKGQ